MAVRRTQNWLSNQRVDTPHLLSIESAVRNDFDELISSFAIGRDKSYVIRGLKINMTGAIGSPATALQMIMANSSFFHGNSSEAGTFIDIPSSEPNQTLNSTTNTRVDGSFTPSSDNYIGVEFTREADTDTSAQVFFWNPSANTEFNKNVPLAKTLDYKIIVTSTPWAANVLPVALVTTNASNNVVTVEDHRDLLFRLGTGGTAPDPDNNFDWTPESRTENFWISSTATSPFEGGDKQIANMKDWADAVMSILKELHGGPFWYSFFPSGSVTKLRADLDRLQTTGTGKWSHTYTTGSQVNWDSDVYLHFIGGRLRYKIEENDSPNTYVTLAEDEVAYLNLVRDQEVTPNLIFSNSTTVAAISGSPDWTTNLEAGDFVKLATEDDSRYFEIDTVDSGTQVTLTEAWDGTPTGSSGAKAHYAYGVYRAVASPTTDRHVQVSARKDVPFEQDTYWLFVREDNGGAAKIYIRGSSGGELEVGESREISDNTTAEILTYIGSPAEVDATPDYLNSIVTSLPETTTVTLPGTVDIPNSGYWEFNSALDIRQYYVWYNFDAAGVDPCIPGRIGIEVAMATPANNLAVAAATQAAIDSVPDFGCVDNVDATITITNADEGVTTDAVNGNIGGAFAIAVDVNGIGTFNNSIIDDENLTRTAKRLDEAILNLEVAIDKDNYEERIDIVAGAPANDRELTGTVTAGTTVKIPKNTRTNIQETYIVGDADMEVFFNGTRLCISSDYTEISETEVEFTFDLEVDDHVKFARIEAGNSNSTSGLSTAINLGPASDADVYKQTVASQLQFRRITAGNKIDITENTQDIVVAVLPGSINKVVTTVTGADHSILDTEDVILLSNGGADRTATLPDATLNAGKQFIIKKLDAGDTLFLASVSNQTLDDVDVTSTPFSITVQYESITVVSDGANWWIV